MTEHTPDAAADSHADEPPDAPIDQRLSEHDAADAARADESEPTAATPSGVSASGAMLRAGIVTVAGRPNAGKSTLLNRMIGEKLSIISPKPQSTRDRVVGILSDADSQMVVLDTPGLLDPAYELQRAMRGAAVAAVRDADVVIYVADATAGAPVPFGVAIGGDVPVTAKVITALNKADRIDHVARARLLATMPDAILISARTGDNIDLLLERVRALLPESPFLYPADEISTQPLRFFASEFVRETALEQLTDEVPYSVACEIEEFRENQSPVYIRAVLYVERESQKNILIGKQGARIKEIGLVARQKIERFVNAKVYLDLWVKVLPNWRRRPQAMRRFGYVVPREDDR